MTSTWTHLSGIFEIDGSSLFVFTMICGSTVMLLSKKVASVFTLVAVFPFSMLLSMTLYHVSTTQAMFDPKNMADWLVWSIVSALTATLMITGLSIIVHGFFDHSGKTRPAPALL
jgi:hypothetical protein